MQSICFRLQWFRPVDFSIIFDHSWMSQRFHWSDHKLVYELPFRYDLVLGISHMARATFDLSMTIDRLAPSHTLASEHLSSGSRFSNGTPDVETSIFGAKDSVVKTHNTFRTILFPSLASARAHDKLVTSPYTAPIGLWVEALPWSTYLCDFLSFPFFLHCL